MSAKAAFELPGEKWWSEETVAVVTGGEFAAPLGVTSIHYEQMNKGICPQLIRV